MQGICVFWRQSRKNAALCRKTKIVRVRTKGIFALGSPSFLIFPIGNLIADGELLRVRNLDKKTPNEIQTRLLALGYEHLTGQEKKRFFYDMIEKNHAAI